jgi:hypothetical protein
VIRALIRWLARTEIKAAYDAGIKAGLERAEKVDTRLMLEMSRAYYREGLKRGQETAAP